MGYPVLQVKSLKKRCADDIATFIKDVLDGHSTSIQSVMYELYPNQEEVSSEMMEESIVKPLVMFKNMLHKHNKTMKEFDYAHDILKFTIQDRNKLWVMRTLLCYQLMIFGTLLMEKKDLHDEIYAQIKTFKRTFRPDVIKELESFKLGIFGSITPTSDIDIGIQYSGSTRGFVALDYVVATMEDMFIHFLGIESTLKLDIEYYADMMTLPNPNTSDNAHPDLFYLDTLQFADGDFKKMIPYAYASIYRNYITAKKDTGVTVHDNRKSVNELSAKMKEYDPSILIDESAMIHAKRMVLEYMNMPYAKAREEYYKFVKIAELKVAKIRDIIQKGSYHNLKKLLILQTMMDIAQSLIFRAESYVCAPTVMHVVRVLQADPSKLKYPVTYPDKCRTHLLEKRLPNPQCEIGKYGFELSKLEQIGYIIRFKMTYCDPPTSYMKHNTAKERSAKCIKKQEKYEKRLIDADERIKGILDESPQREHRRHTRKKGYHVRSSTKRSGMKYRT